MNETTVFTRTRIGCARMPASRNHLAVTFIRAHSRAAAEAQRDACRQYAKTTSLHITYEFAVIGVGSSHAATFNALIGLFYYLNKNPQVSHLITVDFSRLTRCNAAFSIITDMLSKLEVELTTRADIAQSIDQIDQEA